MKHAYRVGSPSLRGYSFTRKLSPCARWKAWTFRAVSSSSSFKLSGAASESEEESLERMVGFVLELMMDDEMGTIELLAVGDA